MQVILGVILLAMCAAGIGALLLANVRVNSWEFVGLVPGLGSGLLSFGVFVLMRAGFHLSIAVILGCALAFGLALIGILYAKNNKRNVIIRVDGFRGLSYFDIALLAAIGALIIFALLVAVYWPPYAWDALSIWVVKGRVINDLGTLAGAGYGAYGFYPLHVPLLIAMILLGLPIAAFKIIFPIYFVLLLFSFGGSLFRLTHRNHSLTLVFVLMLAATPTLLMQSTVAMADVIFTYFYISSALCLLIFVSGGQTGFALLSGLLVGMASWTRPEGLLYFLINTFVLAIYLVRHKTRFAIVFPYLLLFGLFWWPWVRYSGQNTYLTGAALTTAGDIVRLQILWDKLIAVLDYFRREWMAIETWGAAWVLFGVSVLNLRAGRRNPYLLILILLNVAGLVFTYYSVPTNTEGLTLEWWLDTGFVRMATHFLPLLLFYAALVLSPYIDLTVFRSSKMVSRVL